MATTVININEWIQFNKQYFQPPVCNKMMHEKQLKIFYVGGPNQRQDFHIEQGEELFYMKQGDMKLIINEKGQFKTMSIRQGQVFLLPGQIAHSPQRYENTVGLVIERERDKNELDCLRYYVQGSTETLFEKWFYCEDLGTQLPPVINEFFQSEQYKTGQPIPETITKTPPYVIDNETTVEDPVDLKEWLEIHHSEINSHGKKRLFDESYQSDIIIYGKGPHELHHPSVEIWLWQLEGESTLKCDDEWFTLKNDDSFLIPPGKTWQLETREGFVMSVVMDPSKNRKNPTLG